MYVLDILHSYNPHVTDIYTKYPMAIDQKQADQILAVGEIFAVCQTRCEQEFWQNKASTIPDDIVTMMDQIQEKTFSSRDYCIKAVGCTFLSTVILDFTEGRNQKSFDAYFEKPTDNIMKYSKNLIKNHTWLLDPENTYNQAIILESLLCAKANLTDKKLDDQIDRHADYLILYANHKKFSRGQGIVMEELKDNIERAKHYYDEQKFLALPIHKI